MWNPERDEGDRVINFLGLPTDPKKWTKKDHHAYWSYNHSIPTSKEEWTEFMVERLKKVTGVTSLTDEEIATHFQRAKSSTFETPEQRALKARGSNQYKKDRHLPQWYFWSRLELSDWIEFQGFPELKRMFLKNNISGRNLVTVDASALNQMGLQDFGRIRDAMQAIRCLIKVPAPNALRAVIRLVPFEMYLRAKACNTQLASGLSFQEFCESLGFDYDYLVKTKNLCHFMSPTCKAEIKWLKKGSCVPKGVKEDTAGLNLWRKGSASGSGPSLSTCSSSDSEDSLRNVATVENIARTVKLRDKMIEQLYEAIIDFALTKLHERRCSQEEGTSKNSSNSDILCRVYRIYKEAYAELGLCLPEEKALFVAEVAGELLKDLMKTGEILEDMDQFTGFLEAEAGVLGEKGKRERAREAGLQVYSEVASIATMLAMGELDLEQVFRGVPRLRGFVEDLVVEAESILEDAGQEREREGVSLASVLSQKKVELAEWVRFKVERFENKQRKMKN